VVVGRGTIHRIVAWYIINCMFITLLEATSPLNAKRGLRLALYPPPPPPLPRSSSLLPLVTAMAVAIATRLWTWTGLFWSFFFFEVPSASPGHLSQAAAHCEHQR
jgi:hypothetical protein